MVVPDCQLGPESYEISLIFGENFLRLNKELIQIIGLINTAVLCNFKEKDSYFRKFKNSNGTFFLDKKSQEKELNLGAHSLRMAIKELSNYGMLEVKRQGVPPRYWYKVNYNEIAKRVNLYRCENLTFIDAKTEPIINKIKNNKIKSNIKDIGIVPAEQLPSEIEKEPSKILKEEQTLQRKAKKVLSRLNELGFKPRGFSPTPPNLKHIIARLKNYSVMDCIQVLETKIHDPYFKDNPKYYRPKTLFTPENFESYLNEKVQDYEKKQPGVANGSGISGNIDYSLRPGRDKKIKVDKTNWGKYD